MNEEQPVREWFGMFIPAVVWNHPELNCVHKCLYAEIHALGGYKGECYASNEYLGSFVGIGEIQTCKLVAGLIGHGLVRVVNRDGRRRWLKTLFDRDSTKDDLSKMTKRSCQKRQSRVVENDKIIGKSKCVEEVEEAPTEAKAAKPVRKFWKPSLQQVITRGSHIKLPEPECEKFFNHYTAKDWMLGGEPIKQWCPLLENWKKNFLEFSKARNGGYVNGHRAMVFEGKNREIIDWDRNI